MSCTHAWRLPSPEPGAEYIHQTCKRCGTTKIVPAFGEWDRTTKWRKGSAQ